MVLVAIDGLPIRQLIAYRHQWAFDGFARLLSNGAWFANAHHGHIHTVTAAGHAAMLTGAYPERTGIVANEWRNAVSGERVYCTVDTSASYIYAWGKRGSLHPAPITCLCTRRGLTGSMLRGLQTVKSNPGGQPCCPPQTMRAPWPTS